MNGLSEVRKLVWLVSQNLLGGWPKHNLLCFVVRDCWLGSMCYFDVLMLLSGPATNIDIDVQINVDDFMRGLGSVRFVAGSLGKHYTRRWSMS